MYYEKVVDEKSYYLFYHGKYDSGTEPHFTPPHFHDSTELLIVTDGEVNVTVNGEPRVLRAGDILFLDSYDIHSFSFESCERYSLVLSKDYLRMFFEDGKTLVNLPRCEGSDFSAIHSRLSEYYSEYGANIPNKLLVQSLAAYILGILEKSNEKIPKRDNKSREVMLGVMEYIGENSQCELNLLSVASLFGYTPNYFSSIFNRFTDMSFNDYVNYVRYNRAESLLSDGKLSVTEAAMKAGFGSMNTFYRAKNKFSKNRNI